MQNHHDNINNSLAFLQDIVTRRFGNFFHWENATTFSHPELKIEPSDAPLNHFLIQHQLNIEEYTILLLSLMPHIQPNFLDSLIQQYLPNGGDFPEMGGVKGNNHRSMLPTAETALFVLAGDDMQKRMEASKYFSSDHFFAKENIIHLETVKDGEPRMSGKIILQPEYVELFTTGIVSKPSFGTEFPAKLVTTKMEWEDLVIAKNCTTNKRYKNMGASQSYFNKRMGYWSNK